MFLAVLITTLSLFAEPRRGIFPVLTIVCCLGGIAFAFYQFYLQYVPDATLSCGSDLEYRLNSELPWEEIVAGFFKARRVVAMLPSFLSFPVMHFYY